MNNHLPTINQLRKSGYKIKVINKRFYTEFDFVKRKLNKKLLSKFEASAQLKPEDYKYGLLAKGGYTKINATDEVGFEYSAETFCSKNDTFCKKRAIEIVLGRISKSHNFQIKE